MTLSVSTSPQAAAPAAAGQGLVLRWAALALGGLLLLPMVALLLLGLQGLASGSLWHLFATVLPDALVTSAVLAGGTLAGAVFIGAGCAWLVERYAFPGRAVLAWLLVLPLAMPTYVIAYAYTDLLQFSGPIQRFMRLDLGLSWRLPEVRSLPGAVVLFSLVLYPYVYLLARAAFADLPASLVESSRLLGVKASQVFWRVALPMARPAVAAGAALVVMETLADVGATYYFGLRTFSAAIYNAWFALGDRPAALLLALVLLAFVGLLFWMERRARHGISHAGSRAARPMRRHPLTASRAWLATLLCALPVLLGFVLPVLGLGWMMLREPEWTTQLDRFWGWSWNTLRLGVLGATLTLAIALLLAYAKRVAGSRLLNTTAGLLSFGYAVPGAVIALAVLWPLGTADRMLAERMGWTGLIFIGTLGGVLYAYVLRFFAVAYGGIDTGLARITPNLDMAARTLGASRWRLLVDVHLPMLRRPLAVAWLLVLIDVMKELPATLMLRPFNFDTLAVIAQNLAKDERLAEAALPSLAIVALGLIPLVLLSRVMQRDA
jgi:iron(III) transport system permease protein